MSAVRIGDSMTEGLAQNEIHRLVPEVDEGLALSTEVQGDGQDIESTFHAHSLGIKPIGNALTSNENAATRMGHFGRLPDEMIQVLLEWLDSESLLSLGASCRGLFAYATSDQLWKDLFIQYADSFLHPPFEHRSSFSMHGRDARIMF